MMNSEELREASNHLLYEIEMLNISAVKANNSIRRKVFAIDSGDKEKTWRAQIELNLSLDSFAIHARNIMDFLRDKAKKDYVRAEQYLDNKGASKLKQIMKDASELNKYIMDKSNKQVSHITFDRIRPRFKGVNKSWDISRVSEINDIMMKFLDLVDESILCGGLIEWKKLKNPHHYYIKRYIER